MYFMYVSIISLCKSKIHLPAVSEDSKQDSILLSERSYLIGCILSFRAGSENGIREDPLGISIRG